MYSRYDNRPERPVKLPENYSGVAFSERKTAPTPNNSPIAAKPIDVAKPSPPAEKGSLAEGGVSRPRIPMPQEIHTQKKEEPAQETTTENPPPKEALPTAISAVLPHSFSPTLLPHGIGFEELLLIGLILLLSNSEGDRNVILWLALLLFCG